MKNQNKGILVERILSMQEEEKDNWKNKRQNETEKLGQKEERKERRGKIIINAKLKQKKRRNRSEKEKNEERRKESKKEKNQRMRKIKNSHFVKFS